MTTPGVFALLALLAVCPLVALLPYDTGSIRLLGMSLEWWYAGAIAPAVAVLVAALSAPGRSPSPRE